MTSDAMSGTPMWGPSLVAGFRSIWPTKLDWWDAPRVFYLTLGYCPRWVLDIAKTESIPPSHALVVRQ